MFTSYADNLPYLDIGEQLESLLFSTEQPLRSDQVIPCVPGGFSKFNGNETAPVNQLPVGLSSNSLGLDFGIKTDTTVPTVYPHHLSLYPTPYNGFPSSPSFIGPLAFELSPSGVSQFMDAEHSTYSLRTQLNQTLISSPVSLHPPHTNDQNVGGVVGGIPTSASLFVARTPTHNDRFSPYSSPSLSVSSSSSSLSSSPNSPFTPSRSRAHTSYRRARGNARPRNIQLPVTDSDISTAVQDGKTACTVLGCSFVASRGARTDLARHMETHRTTTNQDKWKCWGVLADSQAVAEGRAYEHKGRLLTGGCARGFSRKDALSRHIRSEKNDCIGDLRLAKELSRS
ncbi:uncharacterized protein FIBRA_09163 [Fibroporia radiculosa]|uniref:Uncharacterized protein n=1 Tax=Fibroporia radiculosa TaxID=599839 RepID=J4I3X6_9APHY|nr:uncharacterized protein FIBRA_09163 [Fibroporia radiculosa]CCM06857.1 predicted protein [Fibroporia radiculosa]